MTARMHLALVEAFGSRSEKISSIASAVEAHVAQTAPALLERAEIAALLVALQASDQHLQSSVRELDHLVDDRHRADVVEVVVSRERHTRHDA